MRQIFVTAFLAIGVLAGQAFGDWDIRIYNSSDQLVASYADWQIETAITNLAEGQRMELHPGKVFKPTSRDDFYFRGKRSVTINGGYTKRLVSANPSTEVLAASDVPIPADGSKIHFRGGVPGGLSEGTTYYVKHFLGAQVTEFKVSTTPGGSPVNITSSLPADELCYGYHHAILEPRSSTTSHDYLVNFVDNTTPDPDVVTHSPTIKNLTIDGKGYQSTGHGGGMIIDSTHDSVTGTVTVSGVHVENLRGSDNSRYSNGIRVSEAGDVNFTYCTGQDTGYNVWRTEVCGDVVYDYCRAVDPGWRIFGEETTSARTPLGTVTVKNSVFKKTKAETILTSLSVGDSYASLGNINAKSPGKLASVTFDNVYVDWRDAEGPGMSWDYDGNQNLILIKFEAVETLTIRDSTFLHGENVHGLGSPAKHIKSFKLDNEACEVVNLINSKFSAGFIDYGAGGIGNRNELTVEGCTFHEDGHFDQKYVFQNVMHKKVTFKPYGGVGTKVKNVYSNVFHIPNNWADTARNWTFDGMIVDSATSIFGATTFFITALGNQDPFVGDMNPVHGIGTGFDGTPGISLIDNSYNGVDNHGEWEISNATPYSFTRNAASKSVDGTYKAIAMDDQYVGTGYIMWFNTVGDTRFNLFASGNKQLIPVRYDSTNSRWLYSNNNENGWYEFAPAATDVLLWSTSSNYAGHFTNGWNEVSHTPITAGADFNAKNTFNANDTNKPYFKFSPDAGNAPSNYIKDN